MSDFIATLKGENKLTPVQLATVQFFAVAMVAVAFLIVAESRGYFDWWVWSNLSLPYFKYLS